MKTTTNDPYSVVVSATIDIHTVINAVQEFAQKYPVERLSIIQINELLDAAKVMVDRLKEEQTRTPVPIGARCPRYVGEGRKFCGVLACCVVRFKSTTGVTTVTATPCTAHLNDYLRNGWVAE